MACDLTAVLESLCDSSIGKVTDQTQLLRIIAQLLCDGIGGGGGGSVPSGVILMWSGTIATIPSGYVLCNGANSTPDLRNRFVVAANADSGGQARTTLTGVATQSGGSIAHTHTITDPQHSHTMNPPAQFVGTVGDSRGFTEEGAFTQPAATGITVNSVDAPQPYYALAYIMKT